jgi:Tripartite tricarboxylate transporter family receptor
LPTSSPISSDLGQQFVVEDRGGMGGNLGTQAMINSPPDGYCQRNNLSDPAGPVHLRFSGRWARRYRHPRHGRLVNPRYRRQRGNTRCQLQKLSAFHLNSSKRRPGGQQSDILKMKTDACQIDVAAAGLIGLPPTPA